MRVLFLIVFMVLIMSSCVDRKKKLNLDSLAKLNDYRFYGKIDSFSLTGIDEILDIDNQPKEYPIFGILNKDSQKIIVATIYDNIIFWQSYYKTGDVIACTKFYKDEELLSYYTRECIRISKDTITTLEYVCEDDFEYLKRVSFKVNSGREINYENTDKVYYDKVDVSPDNIAKKYPMMVLAN